jgi:hypothetical protein
LASLQESAALIVESFQVIIRGSINTFSLQLSCRQEEKKVVAEAIRAFGEKELS